MNDSSFSSINDNFLPEPEIDSGSEENLSTNCVTVEELIAGERAERYKRQLERPEVFPDASNWDYIIANKMTEIAPELYRKYLVSWMTPEKQRSDYHDLALDRFPEYIRAIDRETALVAVYDDITSATEATLNLIHKCKLFDSIQLMSLLDEGVNPGFVADCMDAYQNRYTADDISDMQRLRKAMTALDPEGEMHENRSIFGRELRYICPNGHSNSAQLEYCAQCGLNINGLTESQVSNIASFDTRLRILQRLMKAKQKQQGLSSMN